MLVFFQTKFGSPVTVPVNPAGIQEVSVGVGEAGAEATLAPAPDDDPESDELLQPVINRAEMANKQPNLARFATFLVTRTLPLTAALFPKSPMLQTSIPD